MAGGKVRVAIPTKEEGERISPIIAQEFAKAGAGCVRVEAVPFGGVGTEAGISGDAARQVAASLYEYGIVMVGLRPGVWRFVVKR